MLPLALAEGCSIPTWLLSSITSDALIGGIPLVLYLRGRNTQQLPLLSPLALSHLALSHLALSHLALSHLAR